jgi:hypothetical protein
VLVVFWPFAFVVVKTVPVREYGGAETMLKEPPATVVTTG